MPRRPKYKVVKETSNYWQYIPSFRLYKKRKSMPSYTIAISSLTKFTRRKK